MDSFAALGMAEAARRRGDKLMVFDWNKAAKLIKKRRPTHVSAGLRGDWEWTGGCIYKDGKLVPENETYVFLASVWATPEIDIDGDVIDCYILKDDSPGWDSKTYWPESAIEILNS